MTPALERLLIDALQRFDVLRIDAGLEGAWSETVRAIYTPDRGWLGATLDDLTHARFKPCVEVYFEGFWLGLPAFECSAGINRIDEKETRRIADLVAHHRSRPD